ncbi:MAG: hypothetical protein RBT65_09265 [Methanolobus sp.]|nr:hypothetical protein [Methanolobus sp.]
MTKPWHKNEWKEKRKVILKDRDTCEKCGSQSNLCLHHPKGDFRSPDEIRKAISNEVYQVFKKEYEKTQKPKEAVFTGKHRHKSHDYWHDITTKHRTEIDESNLIVEKKITKRTQEEKQNFTIAFRNWKDKSGIKNHIEEEIEKETKRYESLEGIMILCKRCHKIIHEGWEMCPICKDSFKRLNERTCWYCRADKEKERIPLSDPQKNYILSLMNDYSTTLGDKECVKKFLTKIGKDNLNYLYKEEASNLIKELRELLVPVELPCGVKSGVAKEDLGRYTYFNDSKRCYHYCPNEIYDSQDCDRFPKEEKTFEMRLSL